LDVSDGSPGSSISSDYQAFAAGKHGLGRWEKIFQILVAMEGAGGNIRAPFLQGFSGNVIETQDFTQS